MLLLGEPHLPSDQSTFDIELSASGERFVSVKGLFYSSQGGRIVVKVENSLG